MKSENVDISKIEQITQTIQKIAAGEFSARATISDEMDSIDAIASGINMMAEEIEAYTQEKDDKTSALLNMLDDVNEAKEASDQARKELLESEEKYRLLFHEAPVGFVVVDLQGRLTNCNYAASKIIGLSIDEIVGKEFMELGILFEEELPDLMDGFMEAINGDNVRRRLVSINTKNGRKCVEAYNIPLKIDGEIYALQVTLQDITEKKKTEEALQESERKYRTLMDNISDVVMEVNCFGDITFISPQIQDIFGFTPEETLGNNAFDFIHPEDIRKVMETLGDALKDKEIVNLEYRTRHKDGQYRYVSSSGKVVYEGEDIRIVGVIRDITHQKKAEEDLRESEEKYRLISENTSDYISVCDIEGNYIYASPSHINLGYNCTQLIGTSGLDIIHPEDHEKLLPIFQNSFEQDSEENISSVVELRARDNWGKWHTMESTVTFIKGPEEKFHKVVFIARDITERVISEEELRKEKDKAQKYLDIARVMFLVIDRNGIVTLINRKGCEVLGYNESEIIGENWFENFVPPETRRIMGPLTSESFSGELKLNEELEYPVITKEGNERIIAWHNTILFDEERNVVGHLSSGEDITDRKKAKERLLHTMEELERSNTDLQQFAYVASHDLQEPLRMVSSYMQLLERRYKGSLDEDADEFIKYAVDGATRMQSLINDLLTYSRLGTRGKPFKPINMEKVVERALENLKVVIDENAAQINYKDLPVIMADESQIIQLMQNLIGNAIKFRSQKTPVVEISVEAQEGRWLFSVSDNGIGIEHDHKDRIFQIFQRLHNKDEYPGTGIGLAVCKKIVERHEGRIWVTSTPNEGSTFYFTIPMLGGNRK